MSNDAVRLALYKKKILLWQRNVGLMTMSAEMSWRASTKKSKMGKTKEEVFGCDEGGHAGGRSEGK